MKAMHTCWPWPQVDKWRGVSATELPHRSSEILGVQTASAVCAGCTSATLTNPLDVVKTRLQVRAARSSDCISACGSDRSVIVSAHGLICDMYREGFGVAPVVGILGMATTVDV